MLSISGDRACRKFHTSTGSGSQLLPCAIVDLVFHLFEVCIRYTRPLDCRVLHIGRLFFCCCRCQYRFCHCRRRSIDHKSCTCSRSCKVSFVHTTDTDLITAFFPASTRCDRCRAASAGSQFCTGRIRN